MNKNDIQITDNYKRIRKVQDIALKNLGDIL